MSEQSLSRIEGELERDRAALAQALAALRDRMRPASLLSRGAASLTSGAAAVVARATGGGMRASAREDGTPSATAEGPALAGTRFEALSRWEDEGGLPASEPDDPDEDWLAEAQRLRVRALELLARIDEAARRGLAPAADLARHRAEVLAAFAAETTVALGRGLDTLGGQARAQAIAARERVYVARVAVARRARAEVEARPLTAAALAAVAGAVLASLLPRTEAEDRLLGGARDRLAHDLKRLARHEAIQVGDLAEGLSAAFRRDLDRTAAGRR